MIELALNLPWQNGETATINSSAPNIGSSFGEVVAGFGNIAFLIGGFLMLFWLSWGVFQYIFAGGDKEKLARARSRLTWAIVGFIILIIAFFVADYVKTFYKPNLPGGVTTVTEPSSGGSSSGGGSGDVPRVSEGCTSDIIDDCDRESKICRVVNGDPVCVVPGTIHSPLCSVGEKNDCEEARKICKMVNNEPVCVDP